MKNGVDGESTQEFEIHRLGIMIRLTSYYKHTFMCKPISCEFYILCSSTIIRLKLIMQKELVLKKKPSTILYILYSLIDEVHVIAYRVIA
jgi:hypothetical protein